MSKLDDLVVIKVNRKINNENFKALIKYYQNGIKSGFILLDDDCELVNPNFEKEPKWISIYSQMPPKYATVLIYTKNDRCQVIETYNYDRNRIITEWGATHWMPLPEPPEE